MSANDNNKSYSSVKNQSNFNSYNKSNHFRDNSGNTLNETRFHSLKEPGYSRTLLTDSTQLKTTEWEGELIDAKTSSTGYHGNRCRTPSPNRVLENHRAFQRIFCGYDYNESVSKENIKERFNQIIPPKSPLSSIKKIEENPEGTPRFEAKKTYKRLQFDPINGIFRNWHKRSNSESGKMPFLSFTNYKDNFKEYDNEHHNQEEQFIEQSIDRVKKYGNLIPNLARNKTNNNIKKFNGTYFNPDKIKKIEIKSPKYNSNAPSQCSSAKSSSVGYRNFSSNRFAAY